MRLVDFFSSQLQSTFDVLSYSTTLNTSDNLVSPIIDELSKIFNPEFEAGHRYMGTWSRHRLLHHLITYEENAVLPVLRNWKSDGDIPEIEQLMANLKSEEENYDQNISIDSMVEKLKVLREFQIALLHNMTDEDLKRSKMTPFWEIQTLEWILGKSVQHSFEHGNKMLRHALFLKGVREYFIGILKKKSEEGNTLDPKYLETLETHANANTS